MATLWVRERDIHTFKCITPRSRRFENNYIVLAGYRFHHTTKTHLRSAWYIRANYVQLFSNHTVIAPSRIIGRIRDLSNHNAP